MATVRELKAMFVAQASGLKSTIQGVKRDIGDLEKKTKQFSNKMNDDFRRGSRSAATHLEKFAIGTQKNLEGIGNVLNTTSNKFGEWSRDIKSFGKATSKALSPLTAFYATAAITGGSRMIANEQLDILMRNVFRTEESYAAAWKSIEGLTKGTAFMNSDTGQWLSQLVQSNIELDKSEAVMKSIYDFAVGSGQLGIESEIHDVIMKAVRSGGWDQVTLDMMAQRGLNLAGHVANVLGISTEKAQDMLKDGSISMEESLDYFVDAVQVGSEGAGGYFAKMADSATKGGETMTGAWINTKAALAQLGQDMWESGAWDELKTALNNITDFLYQLSPALEPMAKIIASMMATAVEWIQKLMDKFINLRPKTQALIASLTVIGAVLGPVIYFFGLFVGAVSKALKPLGFLFTGLGKVAGVVGKLAGAFGKGGLQGVFAAVGKRLPWLARLFAGLSNPIGIAITVITLLTTAFTIAYKRSDRFREIVDKLGEKIKEVFFGIVDWIKPGFDAVLSFFGEIKTKISEFTNQEGAQLTEAFQNIGSVIETVMSAIWKAVKWTFEQMKWIIGDYVMPAVEFVIQMIWTNIQGIITGALDVIMGAIKIFSGIFTGDTEKMWEGVKQLFSGAIKVIWNWIQLQFIGRILKGVGGLVKSFGSHIAKLWGGAKTTFSSGIKVIWGWMKNSFIGRIISNIVNFSKDFRGNLSQMWTAVKKLFSKQINEIRNSIANSFVGRMLSSIRTLKTNFVNIAKEMWQGVKRQFNNIVDGAKALPGKMGQGISGAKNKAINAMKGVGNNLITWAGTPFNKVIGGVNWVTGKLGIKKKIPYWNYPQYAKGTSKGGHPGGMAMIGEEGRELVQLPDGQSFVSPGSHTLLDLPKGSHVVPNKQTEKILDSDLPHYAKGTSGWQSVIGDVWDYIKNPGKVVAKIWNNIATKTGMAEAPRNIINGGMSYLKDKAMSFIKGGYKEAEKLGGGKPAFGWPITSPFGYRTHPISGGRKLHGGVDFGAPAGTPIPSTTGGTVSYAGGGWNGGFGNLVKVRQGIMEYFYAHMSKIIAKAGQSVNKGTILGLVGSTGASTGPHLHYEARRNGVRVNPMSLKGYADGGIIDYPTIAWLAEGGWAESIISHDPSKHNSQKSIWQKTGDALGFTKGDNEAITLLRRIAKATENESLLQRIAEEVEKGKDLSIIMNERVVGRLLEPIISGIQGRKINSNTDILG